MKLPPKQAGFTAVELLITLFVAAAFLIAAYGLFNLVVKDGGATRAQSRAANIAYDYLRQYSDSATTIPCTAPPSPFNGPVTVDGLTNVNIDVEITCLPDAISSLSKVTVTVTYDAPQQKLEYSTLVSSSGGSSTGDITNGLVAWWKFDGDTNNAIGSPNGINTNATSTTGETSQADTAYAFNGSSSFVQTNSTFGLGTTNVTISLWINNPTATNSGEFVRIGGNGYGVGIGTTQFDNTYAGNKLVMIYEGTRWIPTTTVIGTGWHHIVMVIDGSGVPTGYVDGASTGSFPGASAVTPTGNYSFIGGNAGNTRWFNGSIDDVRIYNRALSLAEILSLYSAGAK